MNHKRKFSVGVGILDGLADHLSETGKEKQYHTSHAVWQLARMGSYNVAGELPLAIRLERFTEIAELYPEHERYVGLMDTPDSDLSESRVLSDILLKFAVRLARIKPRDHAKIQFHVISSAKAVQSNPPRMVDWDIAPTIQNNLVLRLTELNVSTDILPKDTDPTELADLILKKTTAEYHRRRQGRLGDDNLWGRELEALKVLQDTGLSGPDLGVALQALIQSVSWSDSNGKDQSGKIFNRQQAYLLIRDFQRRARIEMPGVRVIDERFLKEESGEMVPFARHPSWKQAIIGEPGMSRFVERDCFDSAVKWARRAAAISGRGLLPIFVFTGNSGNGKSIILKQVAWSLYRQGFAVAEILDIHKAGVEAEQLATAAVAVDSPLVLIWDDIVGPGSDPVPAFKEFAESQVSGVPIVLLCASSEFGYNPKLIKRIPRTVFEEFEVHPPNDAEILRWTSPQPVESPEPVPQSQNETLSDDENPEDVTDDGSAEFPVRHTEPATDASPAPSPESVPSNESRESFIPLRIRQRFNLTLEEHSEIIWKTIQSKSRSLADVSQIVAAMGAFGIPAPYQMLDRIFGEQTLEDVEKAVEETGGPILRKTQINPQDDHFVDMGHPVFVRTFWSTQHIDPQKTAELFGTITQALIDDESLQKWSTRMLQVLQTSHIMPSEALKKTYQILEHVLKTDHIRISPRILSDLYRLSSGGFPESLNQSIIDGLAESVRENVVDSFVGLIPLLRNKLGGIEDTETLTALKSAQPSLDRLAFKFLLKYLGDHLPNNLRQQAVENARTAAARSPDEGYAVAAYLRLVWLRGTEEQIHRAIQETQTWLEANPEDRVVRRAFLDYILKQDDLQLKRQIAEALESWLANHLDEGPLRKAFLELAISFNDPQFSDRVLDQTADWIEKRGNNRAVRHLYFRRAEQRNDKQIMQRACEVAIAWLSNHPDDRDTVRSLLFLTSRIDEPTIINDALQLISKWLSIHMIEKEILKRYLGLVDRSGKGMTLTEAVRIGNRYVEENPDDIITRETILGLAARKVEKKTQIRTYDINKEWLETQTEPSPMMEYLIGRLGVRAGIARRAVPLLERAVSRENTKLRNHARLWLGSAYRIAGEYQDAIKIWKAVLDEDDPEMKSKAQKNLESLDIFLKQKFPGGYPPPEPKPRPRKPREVPAQAQTEPAEITERTERTEAPKREDRPQPSERFPQDRPERRRRPDKDFRHDQQDRKEEPERDHSKFTDKPRLPRRPRQAPIPESSEEPTESRPEFKKPKDRPIEPRRSANDTRKPTQDTWKETPRQGATLGDLLKLKGLDLKEELTKNAKNQVKKTK